MPIRIALDEVLAAKKMKAKQLATLIGVSETHLSLFRSGKVRGVRFSTLARLCAALNCQAGDLLTYVHDEADLAASEEAIE
ncbi:helix-turn-helix transcriptional regulator [Rhodanobacter sp. L36]|uniref:helix-turn-helix domain-containing protein n=1 Tax=Rhodanobacter sp. L36 TaxID=1747221 RepID=UPI00131DDBE2|nr:helix-turn-helix transcriptional regulator [Rhodanobacter sp. L36]